MPQNNQNILSSHDSLRVQTLKHDEKLEVTTKKIPKSKKPPFMAIAGGPFAKPNDKHLLQLIGEMTAPERWFFLYVASKIDHTSNVAIISHAELSGSQVNAKTKAYKALHEKGLLKKVKREHYMVNPNIIIPLGPADKDIFPELIRIWNSI